MNYTKEDCKNDTIEHIMNVRNKMWQMQMNIEHRAINHDDSKLKEPELSIFTEYTPKLANTTYGSDEYKEHLKGMKVGLDHHYANNMHHPEYWENGINDMSLLDIIEMLADWKAATERHNDGDMMKSLEINIKRFNIDDQLANILRNTIKELNW